MDERETSGMGENIVDSKTPGIMIGSPSKEIARINWDEIFVRRGIEDLAEKVARFSIDPDSVAKAELPYNITMSTDSEIASTLGQIGVLDKKLESPDLATDEGVVSATTVAEAKIKALMESTTDTAVRSRLQKFSDKLLDTTGKVITAVGHKKGVVLLTSLALLLSGCLPSGIVPVVPASDLDINSPTTTEVVPISTPTKTETPTQIPTATQTSTPEATAKPEIELVDCTSENFLEHKIPADLIVDKTLHSLEKQNSKPFDQSKIRVDVPLLMNQNQPNGLRAITYETPGSPHFLAEGSAPFRRHLRGVTEFFGNIYAVISLELFDQQHPDENVIIIALYQFNPLQNTDEIKKMVINIMEEKMNVVPLIAVNIAPDSRQPDPLIEAAGTFKLPDIEDRIKRFANNNGFLPNGRSTKGDEGPAVKDSWGEEEHSALDGLVFLTDIFDVIRGNNRWK
jgi:hypothetical protein